MKTGQKSKKLPPYLNPGLSPQRRTRDLLSRMTLEEKAAQMICIWQVKSQSLVDENGWFDEKKAKNYFKKRLGLGQVGRPSDSGGGKNAREMAELTNEIQKFIMNSSRHGIPVVFHEECLHGHAAMDATSFPQPIGLGATFDTDLVQRLYAMTALEARVRGAHQALTPVLDVARDPRWGRVEETFGEDPHLVSCMGVAAVRGFQGDDSCELKGHVLATLKHFAAHGQPESGTNCAPVNVSERILREVFLPPFKRAVQEAGAVSVMASYNEIDGVPSHANRWLLQDILRKEWGFKGYVVSDYYAIRELNERPELFGNFLASDGRQAAELALKAGVNIELPEPDCYRHIVELVRKGNVSESAIDDLVAPMLFWKFRLGLFEAPFVDPDEADKVVGCNTHRRLALQAARKTITLLKNENSIAPLKLSGIRTLAVVGPNADRVMLGGYSGIPRNPCTLLDGIRERVGNSIKVLYHEGCKITVGGSWEQDEVRIENPSEGRRSIQAAARMARRADAVVLALGGNEQTSREAWMGNHLGDRASLEMFGLQDDLVDAIAATGKPVVAFLFNGRPLSIRNLTEKIPVIFECWYLGQESGRAVADVLFGHANPGGKLPITIPRSVGHIPAYYNHKPAARRGYLFDDVSPLYPFGFGLSYTTFAFSRPRLRKRTIRADESTVLRVEVTNSGKVPGEEVVQMYIRDRVSSVTRPVKELKGFKRISLEPGQTETVTFDVTPDSLAFYDIRMRYVVEPGEFEIMVGNSSRDCDLQKLILRVK